MDAVKSLITELSADDLRELLDSIARGILGETP